MGRREMDGLPGGMAKQERRHERWKKDDADASYMCVRSQGKVWPSQQAPGCKSQVNVI